jgi:hypothetical protein
MTGWGDSHWEHDVLFHWTCHDHHVVLLAVEPHLPLSFAAFHNFAHGSVSPKSCVSHQSQM